MKRINKLFTIIMSMFVMLTACFMTPFTAYATDTEEYTSFYYFSDNPDCTTYYNDFMDTILDGYGMSDENRHLYNWSSLDFDERFTAMNETGDLIDIQNAFIVFEKSKGLTPQLIEEEEELEAFTLILRDAFAEWKSNSCKIMFICDTDESRFDHSSPGGIPYNDFLNDVDIHINTDMMTIMMGTILNTIGEDGFEGDSIILNLEAQPVISKYIVPRLRELYLQLSASTYSEEYVLSDDNSLNSLKVIGQTSNASAGYKNYYTGLGMLSLEDIALELDYNGLTAIGSVSDINGYTSYCAWLDSIFAYTNIEFPVYTYNLSGQSVSSQYAAYTNMYETGHGTYHFYNGMNDGLLNPTSWATIFEDFISGEDLSVHHNFDGECDITHKTAIIGAGGWLDFAGYDCWDIYMEIEDWIYYYGV